MADSKAWVQCWKLEHKLVEGWSSSSMYENYLKTDLRTEMKKNSKN